MFSSSADCLPTKPDGYAVSGTTTFGGGSVTVTCDTGYTGSPDTASMTCLATGQWSAPFAGCLQGKFPFLLL